MRKALIVGVDYYEKIGSLHGCVNDALAVAGVLEEHANHGTNFITPNVLTATSKEDAITRRILKEEVRRLFEWDEEIALFYFAGHGYVEDTGGFLCASDSESGDDGLALSEVMTFAHNSRANNRIIILDSCHSGAAAERATQQAVAEIPEGVTILTASTAEQYAMEEYGSGLFTGLLIDALNGAAANLVGDVTPGSIYAHIDQSLGPWVQRPFFKTNVKRFVSLRKTLPPIEIADLRKIKTHFPTPYYQIQLDPAYERERSTDQLNDPAVPPPDPAKNAVFDTLQAYVKVNLARPVGAPHMWHAAMGWKHCELTPLGRHYWNLVAKKLI